MNLVGEVHLRLQGALAELVLGGVQFPENHSVQRRDLLVQRLSGVLGHHVEALRLDPREL